ncbi:hypothetical protein FEI17_25290 [Kosakonia radicincitans]|uniref:hypothetical protein n=1 Tax=Kosakonia radicincitans TaxID=283686 RepID=UPI0008CD97A5|nr:hypothetical protein [Kosakonia radicincitans]MDD7998526.1 hypothetical protein [Kosakonia radicincitans]QEM93727.1 hypothetical protein FEI17_25290 [Kosakonia radicincitans]SET53113.1 hypothetical protein SAMN03159294_4377 [Kosakonia radicincitans]SKC09536.1 hypothetical protein SAMN05216168_1067 [Kosakonia radicincitans]
MKIMSLKNKIYLFWGIMDVLALAGYLFFSIQGGSIPFYSDIHGFYSNYAQLGVSGLTGGLIQLLFFINIALIVSLAFSGWWMIAKKDINNIFLIVQEIGRVFSLKCSIALIPLIMHFSDVRSPWIAILLFVLSEVVKIGSIMWIKRNDESQGMDAASR